VTISFLKKFLLHAVC